jgi:1,4-dihydroxy-2-naphthoate octaprenyltransferase
MPEKKEYEKLNRKLVIGFAAPNTWSASILASVFGVALSFALKGLWDPALSGCMIIICVLMQSAANTLNDYFDYIKKTDTLENCDDPSEAILVYYRLNPKSVLVLGFAFLAAAALPGIWVTMQAGIIPLIIGIIGGIMTILYSYGRLPISSLPLGEIVSGFVMGGLIPLAIYAALSGEVDFTVFLYSLPLILSIAILMNTNNLCDIEKDIPAGKKTIPVLLGRERARILYVALITAQILCIILIVVLRFPKGAILLLPVIACAAYFVIRQARLPLTADTRKRAMAGIVRINFILGLGYIAMILVQGFLG